MNLLLFWVDVALNILLNSEVVAPHCKHVPNIFSLPLVPPPESNSDEAEQLVRSPAVRQILAVTPACTGGLFSVCRGTAGSRRVFLFQM